MVFCNLQPAQCKVKVFNLGLKLWSTNKNYVQDAVKLYNKNLYKYIELFVVPNTYDKFINLWKNLNIPYILHAPHFSVGLNLAKRELFENNMIMVKEVMQYAHTLNCEKIIFHPGIAGDLSSTVEQLNKINDSRILIENKPYITVHGDFICNGYSPEQIKYVLDNTGVKFCCDIGHAICAANSQKIEPITYLKQFISLNPELFHLSDGDFNGIYDGHKHLGTGSFDFKKILKLVPSDSYISIETDKLYENSLKDFEEDLIFLKKLGVCCDYK